MPVYDVLVLGAGPAGWAAASACVAEGLRVHLVAPEPGSGWSHTYGAWLDELAAVAMTEAAGHLWDAVLVRTTGSDLRPLARTYCLLDNDRLRDLLAGRAAGLTTTSDRATAYAVHADRVAVTTASGGCHTARVVIDATGYPAVFGAGRAGPLAYQTAFGLYARFATPPAPPGAACLMDFDDSFVAGSGPSTFLYALDLGEGRWLVEETSLAASPGLPLAVLRDRLEQRLAARRAEPTQVLRTERVAFAMNAPVPAPGPVVAFGAAAGMVHPATGYHVATALRRAPALARGLRTALDASTEPHAVARAGHRALWTAADLRRDALYRFGLDVLLGLDAPATRAFFDGFFRLPPHDWRAYLSRTASPVAVQRSMLQLMRRVPLWLRRQVMHTVVADGAWRQLPGAVTGRALSS